MSVVPFIEGNRILEIGHGPGHLQRILLTLRRGQAQDQNVFAVGIDESAPMGRLAKRNLRRSSGSKTDNDGPTAYAQANLTRGLAQWLPFSNGSFDTLVATFPAEYIFEPATLTEAERVLRPAGKFIILPGAMITGRGTRDRALALLFRVTGETPQNLSEILHERSKEPFARAGFQVEVREVEVKSSLVFIMLATKIQNKE